jgi:hypothetical protein
MAGFETGRHLVVLAVIFQQTPAIILVPRRADTRSVSELRGRTLMDEQQPLAPVTRLTSAANETRKPCSVRPGFTAVTRDPSTERAALMIQGHRPRFAALGRSDLKHQKEDRVA